MPKEFLIRGSKSSEEKHHVTIRGILLLEHVSLFVAQNQTRCQLCKRLVGPIIPFSLSGQVWKRVSTMDVIARGRSTTIFDMVTPTQLTNQPDDYRASLL